MNEETLLQREEKQELFYRLVDLNERGKIHWECVEYIPISFMDSQSGYIVLAEQSTPASNTSSLILPFPWIFSS